MADVAISERDSCGADASGFYNRDGIDSHRRRQILAVWLAAFRPCFTAPVWDRVLVLVAGAVLAPGKRTVTGVSRVMGLADEAGFRRYHEVLSRARWDARAVARSLLHFMVERLPPTGDLARDNANSFRPNATAWYPEKDITFSDAIAAVRRTLWAPPNLSTSRQGGETVTIPANLLKRVLHTLCLAA